MTSVAGESAATQSQSWSALASRLTKLFSTLVLIIGAIAMIGPFVWIFSSSVRPYNEAFILPPQWIPDKWEFHNYQRLLEVNVVSMPVMFKNSLWIAGLVTAGMVMTSSLSGFAFACLRFRGKNIIFWLLLSSLMVPIQATIIPLFLQMRGLGLVDTHWAITLPGLLGAFAPGIAGVFGVFLMRQFFLTLPKDLIDAARIDGAGYGLVFWRIGLPLARPTMAALGIIVFATTWNDYFLPLVFFNSTSQMTLPVGILLLREPMNSGNATILAGVTLSILPVLIVFLLGQRWIVDSFIRAGVKG